MNSPSDFSRMETYVLDLLQEQQLKLGYRREFTRLYIPLSTLQHLLGADNTEDLLKSFCLTVRNTLGDIEVSHKGSRYCLMFSEQAADHVHEHMNPKGFLPALIETVSGHDCTPEKLLGLFACFGNRLHVEQLSGEEFEYLVYFPDGIPNEYRYCLSFEAGHASYHRFIPEDYAEYGFPAGKVLREV